MKPLPYKVRILVATAAALVPLAATGGSLDAAEACDHLPATREGTVEADVLYGSDDPDVVDVIVGLGGDDEIYGLQGDDVICGGSGNDTINGGLGEDRLFGDSGDDNIRGGPDGPVMTDDDDDLFGMSGEDVMNGGAGEDDFDGGSGTDECITDDEDLLSPVNPLNCSP